MKKKTNRGGSRKGAGKKPGPGGTKTPLTIKLTPIVQDFLSTQPNRGKFIESKIVDSQEFAKWKKESGK